MISGAELALGLGAWQYRSPAPWVTATFRVPPRSASLAIAFERQIGNHWCWAASADMVVNTLGANAVQCQTAALVYPDGRCCQGSKPPGTCDYVDWPPFADLGFEFCRTHNRALSFQDLMYEIGVKGTPVAVSWELLNVHNQRTGLGHMAVAGGYLTNADGDWLEIYDPGCGDAPSDPPGHPCGYRVMAFSANVSGTSSGGNRYVHWDDFYGIHR
jgi:peptidase C39-like protein